MGIVTVFENEPVELAVVVPMIDAFAHSFDVTVPTTEAPSNLM